MKKEPKEYHKGFVQTAIDNATQMITLTDAKVGALIALYSLIIAGIIEVRENISDALVAAYNYSTFFFSIILILCVTCLILLCISVIFAIKTVMPTNNPKQNVRHSQFRDEQMWFVMLSEDKKQVGYSLDSYTDRLLNKDEFFCIKCLSYELLKLSYIRNVKNNNFSTSFKFFAYFLIALCTTAVPIVFINFAEVIL